MSTVTVWKDLQNTAQTYTQWKKVELFSLWYCCCRRCHVVETLFHCESESTLFGLPKEDTTRNQWLSCVYNTVPEQFNPNIRVCAAHFTEDYFLNLGVDCQFLYSGTIPTLQGQSGASDSQPVSTFSYLKNLPLTIQTRVLSCVE